MIKLISTISIGFIALNFSFGQVNDSRMSEEEVSYQDKFIEAKTYLLLDEAEKSEEILIDLHKDDRSNPAVALELASLYKKLENPINELKYAKIARQNAQGNESILAAFGNIAMQLEEYNEAIDVYKQLISKSPTNELYTDKYATALLFVGKEKQAINAYTSLESQIGITENVSRRKIEIYEVLGDKVSMIKELEKLISFDPENINALHNLATIHKNEGDKNKALQVYKQILSLDANDTKANIALMGDAEDPNNDGNYLRAINPIIDNKNIPLNNKVLEIIPYTEKLAANPSDAELSSALIELSQRLVAIHPTDAKAYALRADILNLTGNTIDAVKAYEKTLSLNDNVYSVWEQLFYGLSEIGDYNKLASKSELAIDLFPNEASAFYMLGMAKRNLKNPDEAIEYLSEGVLISGKNNVLKSKILTELALCYYDNGNKKSALNSVDKAIDISSMKNIIALELKGDILTSQGDMKTAQEAYKMALTLDPTNTSIQSKIQ